MRLDDPLTPLQVSEVQKLVNQAMGKPFVLIFRASEIQEIRAEGENVSRDGNLDPAPGEISQPDRPIPRSQ
jgi:hypothetical protein